MGSFRDADGVADDITICTGLSVPDFFRHKRKVMMVKHDLRSRMVCASASLEIKRALSQDGHFHLGKF